MQNHLQLPLFSNKADEVNLTNSQLYETLWISDKIIWEHYLTNWTKILYTNIENNEKVMIYVVSKSWRILHKWLFKDIFSSMFYSKWNIAAIEIDNKQCKKAVTKIESWQRYWLFNTNDLSLLEVPSDLDLDYSITNFNCIEIWEQYLYEIKLTKWNRSSYIFYNPLICNFVKFDWNYILRNYQSIKTNKYWNFITSWDLLNNRIYFIDNSWNYNSLKVDNSYHIYWIGIAVQNNNNRYIVDEIDNNKLLFKKFVINDYEVEILDDLPTLNAPSHFTIPWKQFYSAKINWLDYIILDDNIGTIKMWNWILVNWFDTLTKLWSKIIATKKNIKYEITRDEKDIKARQIF